MPFQKILLVSAIASALSLAGCGGGGGGSSSGNGSSGGETTSISGVVEVPAASVTAFENQGTLASISSFFITPAAAAVLGLETVEGALVELIRIDNDGNQIGDPIDTTYTSITGDYELELPPGVDLSGDLVVRISGTNDVTMTAMVVEQDVDINPITDFVARKFIESDADLDTLQVTEVVELRGKADAFDLTATPGTDITAMLEILEDELGDFVESAVVKASTEEGNTSTITGDYRSTAFSIDMHDSDGSGYGTLNIEMWLNAMSIVSSSDGSTIFEFGQEEGADVGLSGPSVANGSVWFDVWMDDLDESFPVTYLANGVLAVEGSFKEELDTDEGYGWRSPPMVYNLQQVGDHGLFVLLSQEASVRYQLNEANTGINPEAREGDEISRALEFFARKPSGMTAADLNGDFGRVYIESILSQGSAEVLTEFSTVTFHGNGTLDVGESYGFSLNLNGSGTQANEESDEAENSLSINVTADGDIVSIGGEDTDGFINDAYNFISIVEAEGTEGSSGQVGQTLMVKLPTSMPTVTGKRYRVMSMAMGLSGSAATAELDLTTSLHKTFLTMDSEETATLEGASFEVLMNNLGGDMEVEKGSVTNTNSDVIVEIEADGMTYIEIPEESGTNYLTGYFNEDASMALLLDHYAPSGQDPTSLGLAILVEIKD